MSARQLYRASFSSREAFLGYAFAILSVVPAVAADLPSSKGSPAFVPPPPAVFTWTGVYIGGQVGYGWGTNNWNTINASTETVVARQPSDHPRGVVGGVHIGYNYEISQFVFGVEGDADGSAFRGSTLNNVGSHSLDTKSDIGGSIRGRVGYAWDRVLIYAAGGLAIAPVQTINTNLGTGGADSYTHTVVGWTVGGGMEYSLDNNWSVRVEYRYSDYAHTSAPLINSIAAPGTFGNRFHVTENLVQAGFSYKFDTSLPPVSLVTKY